MELLPSVKLAVTAYLAAGRLFFFLIRLVLSNVFLQRMLQELRLLRKPERFLLDPLHITLKVSTRPQHDKAVNLFNGTEA